MQILNLIRPEKSDVKYEVIQFPDGEPHIVLNGIDRKDDLTVVCRICNPTEERTIYVTHMVNPKGITTLSENYKEVYFTNSYKDWNKETLPNNVKVIEIV